MGWCYYNEWILISKMNKLSPTVIKWKSHVFVAFWCAEMCDWALEFSLKWRQCGILTVWSSGRAPHIHQSLTCALSKLSLDSPLSRRGALASSSLLTCVMIEEDGWSMRSVKPVKSQLKKGFRIKIFRLATTELKKKKEKNLPANAPKIQKTFTA